mmetsp:Transcript_30170/g.59217  ORF Transcript_30170/g.59217 Transcript_30170/m.59217 type:complete len:168 (+) Transcript_30170:2987-3490(+)
MRKKEREKERNMDKWLVRSWSSFPSSFLDSPKSRLFLASFKSSSFPIFFYRAFFCSSFFCCCCCTETRSRHVLCSPSPHHPDVSVFSSASNVHHSSAFAWLLCKAAKQTEVCRGQDKAAEQKDVQTKKTYDGCCETWPRERVALETLSTTTTTVDAQMCVTVSCRLL